MIVTRLDDIKSSVCEGNKPSSSRLNKETFNNIRHDYLKALQQKETSTYTHRAVSFNRLDFYHSCHAHGGLCAVLQGIGNRATQALRLHRLDFKKVKVSIALFEERTCSTLFKAYFSRSKSKVRGKKNRRK